MSSLKYIVMLGNGGQSVTMYFNGDADVFKALLSFRIDSYALRISTLLNISFCIIQKGFDKFRKLFLNSEILSL